MGCNSLIFPYQICVGEGIRKVKMIKGKMLSVVLIQMKCYGDNVLYEHHFKIIVL